MPRFRFNPPALYEAHLEIALSTQHAPCSFKVQIKAANKIKNLGELIGTICKLDIFKNQKIIIKSHKKNWRNDI
jgi:hypothetical protein